MNAQAIVDGLRSGNSWVVNGDLIDSLIFKIDTLGQNDGLVASMGSNMLINKGNSIRVTILVRDPQGANFNTYSSFTTPSLDHIDLIKGKVTGFVAPTSPLYSVDSVTTTSVIARFDAQGGITDANGVTSTKWTSKGNGWYEMSIVLPAEESVYFRLRGSNFGLNVPMQTDGAGNPLADVLLGANDAAKAFDDLWFYSNPIFVTAQEANNDKTIKVKISSASDDLEEFLPALPGQTQSNIVGGVDSGSSDLELGLITTGTEDPQLVGLRFVGLNVPKNAEITAASIEFEADATNKNASPCNLQIYAEDNDSPLTFGVAAFELTKRPKLADSVVWVINAGDGEVVNGKCSTSDITRLVQQLVNRAGWKAGNAMAFYIKGTGTREMESFDGESAAAASISISYKVAEIKKTSKIKISAISDDVEEWLAPNANQTQAQTIGAIDYNSSDLELGCENGLNKDPQMVGLRFPNIKLPKNKAIAAAYLEFEVDATSKNANPTNLSIWSEDNANPVTFDFDLFSLTKRAKSTDSVVWNIPTNQLNVVDSKGLSADIKTLVQANINRADWNSGNAMAFFIKGSGVREVESFDGEAAAAPSLVIEYYDIANSFDSVFQIAAALQELDFTVPSRTKFKQFYVAATSLY
ncbi:MAG: hypothetical protein IPO21_20325 [Bacteroidales bacterium]|nr:hypothetical protein [Bacteroidales bacterium]